MAANNRATSTPLGVLLNYQLLRNTTGPDEVATDIKSYVVNLSAFEILKLDTEDNLRGYIAEYNPRKRNRIHDAIRTTIEQEPRRFITRNSGFVISASKIAIDDGKKTIRLIGASILNGAQSQGEIRRWIEETYEDNDPEEGEEPPFYVRAEIIVVPDSDEVIETAIARNAATPVRSITQIGARGHLDELEASIKTRRPDIAIRKRETDTDVYDTRKILQFTRLLMPASVSGNDSPAETLRAYKNPEQCLTEFSGWYEKRDVDPESRIKYEFTIKMAPFAIEENELWERHNAWNGHRLWEETKKGGRACRRDRQTGEIVWVSPGLVFPILRAMSEFVEEDGQGSWTITKPTQFRPAEMIANAVSQFRSLSSDPMQMGRSAGAYDALRYYSATLVSVLRDLQSTSA